MVIAREIYDAFPGCAANLSAAISRQPASPPVDVSHDAADDRHDTALLLLQATTAD
jgi:hypothetical protein